MINEFVDGIEFKNVKFLITDMPLSNNVTSYIKTLQEHNVTTLVRFSLSTYNSNDLQAAGVSVYDLVYPDGSYPGKNLIKQWMHLLKSHFENNSSMCVAVHSSAGLGRAPVMIALALIELGLQYDDAVELIREKRKYAINSTQLTFLQQYRRKSLLSSKNGKRCTIL